MTSVGKLRRSNSCDSVVSCANLYEERQEIFRLYNSPYRSAYWKQQLKLVRLVEEVREERKRLTELVYTLREQKFVCYLCQSRLALSSLVLNDKCRHNICRVCFSKLIVLRDTNTKRESATRYQCLACPSSIQETPSFLVTLSAGVLRLPESATEGEFSKVKCETVGYRVKLIEN